MRETMMETIQAKLPRGDCPVLLFGDARDRSTPIVLLFMDAFGPRPALHRIASRLAGLGCRVLLPDLFYEHLPYPPLDPQSLFSGGPDRARLGTLLSGIDQAALDADVGGLLALCAELSDGAPQIGATGYCMGGRYAITAASLSPQVLAAACFHSSFLAPVGGESAHTRLGGTKARIYVGIAEIDPTFDAEEEGRLAQELRRAATDHMIESYPGAAHGFVMDDLPVHHPTAAARHWQRLEALFTETLELESA